MFTIEEKRENMKRMIFNNKDNTRDIGRKKMTGERARETSHNVPQGSGPGGWESLEELIRVSSNQTLSGQLVSTKRQQMFFWKKNGGMIVTGKYCDLQTRAVFH